MNEAALYIPKYRSSGECRNEYTVFRNNGAAVSLYLNSCGGSSLTRSRASSILVASWRA